MSSSAADDDCKLTLWLAHLVGALVKLAGTLVGRRQMAVVKTLGLMK